MSGTETWLGLDLDTATTDYLAIAMARCLREHARRTHVRANGTTPSATTVRSALMKEVRRYLESDMDEIVAKDSTTRQHDGGLRTQDLVDEVTVSTMGGVALWGCNDRRVILGSFEVHAINAAIEQGPGTYKVKADGTATKNG